mgnify:CR=1 FL=1
MPTLSSLKALLRQDKRRRSDCETPQESGHNNKPPRLQPGAGTVARARFLCRISTASRRERPPAPSRPGAHRQKCTASTRERPLAAKYAPRRDGNARTGHEPARNQPRTGREPASSKWYAAKPPWQKPKREPNSGGVFGNKNDNP